jgi:hypothetical protein
MNSRTIMPMVSPPGCAGTLPEFTDGGLNV